MSRIFKICLFTILILSGLVIAGGLIITFRYQDDVKRMIINGINSNVRTEIRVSNLSFSVFRRFPHASVIFTDVVIHVPSEFLADSDTPVSDTLFSAEQLSLRFNILDIFRGNYRITSINARNGVLYPEVNSRGDENFRFWEASETVAGEFNLNLQDVALTDYLLKYHDRQKGIYIDAGLKKLQMKGDFSHSYISLMCLADGSVRRFKQGEFELSDLNEVSMKISLAVDDDLVAIDDGFIDLAGNRISATGIWGTGDNSVYNMEFAGRDLDISSLTSLAPSSYLQDLGQFEFGGRFGFKASYSGVHSGPAPHINANFIVGNGRVRRRDTGGKLTNIMFQGQYSNGAGEPSSSSFAMEGFSAELGNGSLKGRLRLVNLLRPKADFKLEASLMLEDLAEFYQPGNIMQMKGHISTAVTGSLQLQEPALPGLRDLAGMQLSGQLQINDGLVGISSGKYVASHVEGELIFGNTLRTSGLTFFVDDDHFRISGEIDNGLTWLLGDNTMMKISGTLYSRNINLDKYFIPDDDPMPQGKHEEKLIFPDNVEVNLGFLVDNLAFRDFRSTDFSGRLSYKPYMMVLNSVDFNSMEGSLSGNGVIVQHLNGDFMVQSQLQLQNVDMQKMFLSFGNFGQSFIHGEHLRGRLSGDLGIVSEWNRELELIREKLAVNSNIEIRQGELVNFEPMMGLARFINVSELQHIRFSTLRNEILIRDQIITIPQMDINSSAFNIRGSGIHHFDGYFDYRIRVLLSEILFGRARQTRPEITSYGIIENEPGRTGLFLKVEGTVDDYNVSWDPGAVRDAIRDNLANERRVLRQLLHEEFGLFSSDSTVVISPVQNNARFRITWDEEDEKTNSPEATPGRGNRLRRN